MDVNSKPEFIAFIILVRCIQYLVILVLFWIYIDDS